ncbi:MAG: hypothetical protein U0176_24495 [Bacteroidia bacterium]
MRLISAGTSQAWYMDSLVLRLQEFHALDFDSLAGVRYSVPRPGFIVEEEYWSKFGATVQEMRTICKRKLDIHIPLKEDLNPRIILTEFEVGLGFPPKYQRLLLLEDRLWFEKLVIGKETLRIRKEFRLMGLDEAIAILDAYREAR